MSQWLLSYGFKFKSSVKWSMTLTQESSSTMLLGWSLVQPSFEHFFFLKDLGWKGLAGIVWNGNGASKFWHCAVCIRDGFVFSPCENEVLRRTHPRRCRLAGEKNVNWNWQHVQVIIIQAPPHAQTSWKEWKQVQAKWYILHCASWLVLG